MWCQRRSTFSRRPARRRARQRAAATRPRSPIVSWVKVWPTKTGKLRAHGSSSRSTSIHSSSNNTPRLPPLSRTTLRPSCTKATSHIIRTPSLIWLSATRIWARTSRSWSHRLGTERSKFGADFLLFFSLLFFIHTFLLLFGVSLFSLLLFF